jgi:hypothetical protein
MSEFKLEIFRKWEGRLVKFGDVIFPAFDESAKLTVQTIASDEDNWIRPNFKLTVQMIDAGLYGKTWAEFREEILRAVKDGEYGELEEIGSSDMNHMIVGRAAGMKVIA